MIQATQFSTMGGPVGDPWHWTTHELGLIHSTKNKSEHNFMLSLWDTLHLHFLGLLILTWINSDPGMDK